MFDQITQTVDGKDVAKSIKALPGMFLTPTQLTKKLVTDSQGKVHYVCPGMITRIKPSTVYNPTRPASRVFYITGDDFEIDLEVAELARQLGLSSEGR